MLVTVCLLLATLAAGFIALIVIFNTSLPASVDNRIRETGSALYFRSAAYVA
jgi:acyl-coenzyme A synthetase/AMP-(fatty) acid ligase